MKMQKITNEHKIIVEHLRESRNLSKNILKVSNEYGSAIIEHKFIIKNHISEKIDMITEITFLPMIRLYKQGKTKIIDDENLLNEDIEDVTA